MEQLNRIDDILLLCRDMSKTAIIYDDVKYSYQDLFDGMINVAGMLLEFNVYTDKIIVLLGNRPEAVSAIMGISYAGGTFIPVADNITSSRLTEIINDSGATTILTDKKHYSVINNLDDTPMLTTVYDIDHIKTYPITARAKPAYPAALMYTSGTTGIPKGVICPHEKMINATLNINSYMQHDEHDIVATTLPLSHGYGLYQIFTVLAANGTVLLEPNFSFPPRTLDRIKKYKATGFAAVPSMISMIFKFEGWKTYLDNLVYITTAGSALPPTIFEKLSRGLPRTNIVPMYGQTECVRTLYNPSSFKGRNYESCGVCIPGTTTMLTAKDENGVGELVVESSHVMDGYWNNEEETHNTFQNDTLYYTGDLFKIDENGFHYYVGRKDDVVKIKGERCSPQELDNVLMKMPEIDEAASFAVDDELWGKRFVVYVSSKNYLLQKRDVMRFCKANIEAFLMPKDVVIVDTIPKTENGKISRDLLKCCYLENREVEK